MGAQWLEKNLGLFLDHILSLASNPRSTQTHIDAVYSRRCIVFVMSQTVQGMLGEKAQVNAAKELTKIINREMDIMSKFFYVRDFFRTVASSVLTHYNFIRFFNCCGL